LVALPARTWRPYAGPVALLLAATVAVGLVRTELRHHHGPAATGRHRVAAPPVKTVQHKRYYAVHAGDTLSSIAVETHVSLAALRRLNPNVQPTALFLGEKLRVR
jgi:spore germination protein YaaH